MIPTLKKAFGPDRCARLAVIPPEEPGEAPLLIIEPLRIVKTPVQLAVRAANRRYSYRARRA